MTKLGRSKCDKGVGWVEFGRESELVVLIRYQGLGLEERYNQRVKPEFPM